MPASAIHRHAAQYDPSHRSDPASIPDTPILNPERFPNHLPLRYARLRLVNPFAWPASAPSSSPRLYHAKLAELGPAVDAEELHASWLFPSPRMTRAGQAWCEGNTAYPGYTSYALADRSALALPDPSDALGQGALECPGVAAFRRGSRVRPPRGPQAGAGGYLDQHPLPEGGIHTSHIHPHSVISGTTYVQVPPGARSIKLEDPRHAMMMAAPQPPQGRARGAARLHLPRPAGGRRASVGILAAPRGADEHGRG